MPVTAFIGGTIPVAITATDFDTSTTTTSCATIANVNLGAADANRFNYLMFVRYDAAANSSVGSVSVGGLACELVATMGSTRAYQQQLWRVNSGDGTSLSASTSATVIIITSTGDAPCALAAYQVIGGTLDSSATPAEVAGATLTSSLGVTDGSGIISSFMYLASLSPGAPAVTWTNMTEDYDQNFGASGANQVFSTAHRTDAAAATVAVTSSGSGGTPVYSQMLSVVLF